MAEPRTAPFIPRPEVYTGTDPAAGVEVSITVPSTEVWDVMGVHLTLATDATAGTRWVRLSAENATTRFMFLAAPAGQAASLSRSYSFVDTGYTLDASSPGSQIIGMPLLTLGPGWKINTLTQNIQAGDNFAAPVLYVVRYSA